ncbi:MAG: hypothetical protein ACI8ZM_000712 [Crocinitomix sp.]|jgi:hypothetical protein
MKTRQEYVAICQTCIKSKFDKKKGLVCGLTNEHAAFHTTECPDYEAEKKAIKRQEANERREIIAKEEQKGIFAGNGGIIGGIALIILAIVWVTVGLVLMDRIFFYPIVLVIGGIITISKGVDKKKSQTRREHSMVIDDDFDEII